MLKISQVKEAGHSITLQLEGRIVGPWVTELRQSCEQVLQGSRPLKLHFAGIEYMDADAVAFLTTLRPRGVVFIECPPFVAEQLKVKRSA